MLKGAKGPKDVRSEPRIHVIKGRPSVGRSVELQRAVIPHRLVLFPSERESGQGQNCCTLMSTKIHRPEIF